MRRVLGIVVQSSRMGVSRLRRAGVLLFVLWLTADVAAFGFCSGDPLITSASSVTIGAASDSDATSPCCTGHHCFCCSSGAEVVRFELSHDAEAAFMAPLPEPRAADTSIRNTSPPPRF